VNAQPFDCQDWEWAFGLCRDLDRPITASVTTREGDTVTVTTKRIFPSGYAKCVRTETTYYLAAQYAQREGGAA